MKLVLPEPYKPHGWRARYNGPSTVSSGDRGNPESCGCRARHWRACSRKRGAACASRWEQRAPPPVETYPQPGGRGQKEEVAGHDRHVVLTPIRPPLRDRKFADSLLEGAGFELLVPLTRGHLDIAQEALRKPRYGFGGGFSQTTPQWLACEDCKKPSTILGGVVLQLMLRHRPRQGAGP